VRHIRIDNEIENSKRRFACGIGPELPAGDTYVFQSEVGWHHTVDCPGCAPTKQPLGTPISELSGQPGHKGYEKFKEIAHSWGYD
jgi:hypothetical protein